VVQAQQSAVSVVCVIAHIGNVPVEEWLPFLVPVVALYLYGRHRDRRRTAAVQLLPPPHDGLDLRMVRLVLDRWAAAEHAGLSAEHVALLYPPGPEGMTESELAARTGLDPTSVSEALEQLEGLGYVELDGLEPASGAAPHERRVWLTAEGYDLLLVAETALLGAPAAATREGQAR
jgi:DNA-binding transcriptional ArsR family regulator